MDNIKIFIGTEPKTELPLKVLIYSLQKHITPNKDILDIQLLQGFPWAIRPNAYIGTGFSLLRWDIPRLCNYEGFAIYMDVDIVCLRDITELWRCDVTYPNGLTSAWCTYQKSKWFDYPTPETSVMLIDCARAKLNQPSLEACLSYIESDPKPDTRTNYVKIMRAMKNKVTPQAIPNRFNSLNAPEYNAVLLHYTKEPEQPWYYPKHPHREIWEKYLKECLDIGVILKEELRDQIADFKPHTNHVRGQGLHPFYRKYC